MTDMDECAPQEHLAVLNEARAMVLEQAFLLTDEDVRDRLHVRESAPGVVPYYWAVACSLRTCGHPECKKIMYSPRNDFCIWHWKQLPYNIRKQLKWYSNNRPTYEKEYRRWLAKATKRLSDLLTETTPESYPPLRLASDTMPLPTSSSST